MGPAPNPAFPGPETGFPADSEAVDPRKRLRHPAGPMPRPTLAERLLRSPLPLMGVVLAACLLVLHRGQTREIDPDEIEALHSGWMVSVGEAPYADFVQQHHPAQYWLLAGVMRIAGEGPDAILAARAVHFGWFLLSLGLVWLLAREVFGPRLGRRVGLFALCLLATSGVYANKMIEVRPDVPMLTLGLVALYGFLRHDRDRRARWLLLGGAALGLSFLFLQKALFSMAALAVLCVVRLARGRMRWGELALALGGVALVLVPFYAQLVLSGSFGPYYTANWTVNADGDGGFGPVFWLIQNVRLSTVLWAFFAAGLVFYLEGRRERELAFVTVALLASLWIMQRPWMYYSLPMLPLVALIAGAALGRAFEGRLHVAHALVLFGAAPGLYYLGVEPYRWNVHGLALIELGRTNTPPDGRVHDGQNLFNVFRRPLDYYWYSLGENGVMERFEKVRPRGYDLEALLEVHRPPVVATAELERVSPELAARYEPAPLDPRVSLLRGLHTDPEPPTSVARAEGSDERRSR